MKQRLERFETMRMPEMELSEVRPVYDEYSPDQKSTPHNQTKIDALADFLNEDRPSFRDF